MPTGESPSNGCIFNCGPTQAQQVPQTGQATPPQTGQNPVTTAPNTPATTPQAPTTTPRLRTPTPETTTSTTSSKARDRDDDQQRSSDEDRKKNSGTPYQAAEIAALAGTYRRKKLTETAVRDGQVVSENATRALYTNATTVSKPVQMPGPGNGGRLPDPAPGSLDPGKLDPPSGSTVFGRITGQRPQSANDELMARALDPSNRDPKYDGVDSAVQYARIKPVKGQGVVRMNLFIPGREVINPSLPRAGYNGGDNRDFNPSAEVGDSRVSLFIDYENGLIVARQNPSTWNASAGAGASKPSVEAPSVLFRQGKDGTVMVSYMGVDPFQIPGADKAGVGVKGNVWVTPQGSDPVGLSGKITGFPSAEVYQYRPDGTVSTIAQHRATGSDWGPAVNLPLGLNTSIVGSSGPAEFIPYGETPLQAVPGA